MGSGEMLIFATDESRRGDLSTVNRRGAEDFPACGVGVHNAVTPLHGLTVANAGSIVNRLTSVRA